MALMIIGIAYANAEGRVRIVKNRCGTSEGKVCRGSEVTGYSCYKTNFAQNYQVCRNDQGYFICCEKPKYVVTTQLELPAVAPEENQSYPGNEDLDHKQQDVKSEGSYEGYYPKTSNTKNCYAGNNAAKLNRAPYKGCSSPQSEGSEKNKERNINVSTPNVNAPLAPVNGNNQ